MKNPKFYTKKWFLWLCLFLVPPLGILLLWTSHKEMKAVLRIVLSIVFAAWFIVFIALLVPSNETGETSVADQSTMTNIAEVVEDKIDHASEKSTTQSRLDADGFHFNVTTVRNDVTGNWRIAVIHNSLQMKDYAIDYYNEYFQSDSEVHAIVNLGNKTTTRINVFGNTIYLTVLEYVDGEEHDANILFSGMVLKDYQIDKQTGEITEL